MKNTKIKKYLSGLIVVSFAGIFFLLPLTALAGTSQTIINLTVSENGNVTASPPPLPPPNPPPPPAIPASSGGGNGFTSGILMPVNSVMPNVPLQSPITPPAPITPIITTPVKITNTQRIIIIRRDLTSASKKSHLTQKQKNRILQIQQKLKTLQKQNNLTRAYQVKLDQLDRDVRSLKKAISLSSVSSRSADSESGVQSAEVSEDALTQNEKASLQEVEKNITQIENDAKDIPEYKSSALDTIDDIATIEIPVALEGINSDAVVFLLILLGWCVTLFIANKKHAKKKL